MKNELGFNAECETPMSARLQALVAAAESGDAEAMTDLALVHARGEKLQRVDLPADVVRRP